ncbi:MAG TPA: hypothetical protein VMS32_03980 [Verrucomicrobiae bacterium]|nr:hypothetical protein [Verrucomicrobiae bacterium]
MLGISNRFLPLIALCAFATSCTPPISTQLPSMMTVSATRPTDWPLAPVAAADAAPAIARIWMSTLQLHQGESFDSAILTSTNVASVEVRTASFSIDVPRTSFGHFAFHLKAIVLPSFIKHTYVLWIIARNTAGTQDRQTAYLDVGD